MSLPRSNKFVCTYVFICTFWDLHFCTAIRTIAFVRILFQLTCTPWQGTRGTASCHQSECWGVWSCQQSPRRCRGRLDGLPHCRFPPGTTKLELNIKLHASSFESEKSLVLMKPINKEPFIIKILLYRAKMNEVVSHLCKLQYMVQEKQFSKIV